MANKINQITIGDMLILQLDGNPATDGIGYDCPAGSIAMTLGGSMFVKLTGPVTRWHTLTMTFLQGGNGFGTTPELFLGSNVDKNMGIIRNNLMMLQFRSQTTDVNFAPTLTRFTTDSIQIIKHITKNNEYFNYSTIFSNKYEVQPLNDVDRKSIMINSAGVFHAVHSLGVGSTHNPSDNQIALGDTNPKTIRDVSAGRMAHLYNAPLTFTIGTMEQDQGLVMMSEIIVLAVNTATGEISQRKKTFTIELLDANDRTYNSPFNADNFSWSKNVLDELDFELNFANDPNSIFDTLTNTFLNNITITGLQIGQTYHISVWQKRLSLESL